MTGALVLAAALLLAQGVDPARAAAARRELADVAARIEELKAAGVRGGPEIERLLARSQALSDEVERLERTPRDRGAPGERPAGSASAASGAPPAADPRELRERADTLRDEVDRLTATLAAIDERLREEGRRRRAGRLAAMEEEGALFAEASPGRVSAPPRGGASGASGPQGPTGPTGADPAVQPPGPVTGPIPVTPPPAPPPTTSGPDGASGGAPPSAGTVWSGHGDYRTWGERLAPARGDGEPELRRKKDAVTGAIGEARRQIERIEAEARELDARP